MLTIFNYYNFFQFQNLYPLFLQENINNPGPDCGFCGNNIREITFVVYTEILRKSENIQKKIFFF